MFDIQSYQKAESVSDAIRLLGEDPEARLIAGGTDVLTSCGNSKVSPGSWTSMTCPN